MSANFEHYKIFYYVAKYNNITTASKFLYMSQSTVSRIIQTLEHELGTQLFIRSKKGAFLTDTGRELYNHVSQACEHIFKAEEKVRLMERLDDGVIHIGTTEMVMRYVLLDPLNEFQRRYPRVHMDISFQDPSTVEQALQSGLIDVAILTSPLGRENNLNVYRWKRFDDLLIAGEKFSELKSGEYFLKDLKDYPFVAMRSGMSGRAYLESAFLDQDVELIPTYESGSMPFLLDMIGAGYGIGFAPDYFIKEFSERVKLFEINLKQSLPKRDICIITGKMMSESLVSKEFIEICRQF